VPASLGSANDPFSWLDQERMKVSVWCESESEQEKVLDSQICQKSLTNS
jgi:hypothetical protein